MNLEQINKVKQVFRVLNNTTRLRILFLCKEKEMSITEISKKLNLSYTTTSEYVGMLEYAGLIRKLKKDKKVFVGCLVEITEDGEIRRKK